MSSATGQKTYRGTIGIAVVVVLLALVVFIEFAPPIKQTDVDLSTGRRRVTRTWLGFTFWSEINENPFSQAVSNPHEAQWVPMFMSGRGLLGSRMHGSGAGGRIGGSFYDVGRAFELLEVPSDLRREIASSVLSRIQLQSDLNVDWDDHTLKITIDGQPLGSWQYAR